MQQRPSRQRLSSNAAGFCSHQARACNRAIHRNLGISGESFSWDLTLEILVPGGCRLLRLSNLWWKDMGSYTREK